MGFIRSVSAAKASLLLAGAAAIHVAWAKGSFPFETREELARNVVGTDQMPSPGACYAVAGALGTASALAGGCGGTHGLARLARTGATLAIGARGAYGMANAAGLLGEPRTMAGAKPTEEFTKLDAVVYSPLCLLIAALMWIGRPRKH